MFEQSIIYVLSNLHGPVYEIAEHVGLVAERHNRMVDNDKIVPKCFGDEHQKRLLLVREQCKARQVVTNTCSHQGGYNTG